MPNKGSSFFFPFITVFLLSFIFGSVFLYIGYYRPKINAAQSNQGNYKSDVNNIGNINSPNKKPAHLSHNSKPIQKKGSSKPSPVDGSVESLKKRASSKKVESVSNSNKNSDKNNPFLDIIKNKKTPTKSNGKHLSSKTRTNPFTNITK